ncbi:MAG: hypothetical protein IT438_10130 [Phycisphaerales bacterium]|nr:hypothetical protein [Phycisphaerales bacterium]
MKFPVDEVQFWVGTGAFVVAVWWLVRGAWVGRKAKRAGKRVELTVGGRGVRRGK